MMAGAGGDILEPAEETYTSRRKEKESAGSLSIISLGEPTSKLSYLRKK